MSQKLLLKPKPPEAIAINRLLFRPRNSESPNQSRRLMSDGLVAHYPVNVEADLVIAECISEILQEHQSCLGKGIDHFAIAIYWGNKIRIEAKPLERLRWLQDSNWRTDFWKTLGDRAESYNPTTHLNIGYISGDGLGCTKLQAIMEV
jgi:hypothetical protein